MRTRMYGGVRGRKTKIGGKPTFVFLLLDYTLANIEGAVFPLLRSRKQGGNMEMLETPADTRTQPHHMRNTAMARISMGQCEQGILGSGA